MKREYIKDTLRSGALWVIWYVPLIGALRLWVEDSFWGSLIGAFAITCNLRLAYWGWCRWRRRSSAAH